MVKYVESVIDWLESQPTIKSCLNLDEDSVRYVQRRLLVPKDRSKVWDNERDVHSQAR